MWQRKVEIPNIEFHELSDASVQTRKLSQSSIRYLISDGALDNLCVLRGSGSGSRNSADVTLSAVEGDRITSTGQVSLWDTLSGAVRQRVSSWTYRRTFCSTKWYTQYSSGRHSQKSLVQWLRLLLHRRYQNISSAAKLTLRLPD